MIAKEILINKLQRISSHIKRDKYGKPIILKYAQKDLVLDINEVSITFQKVLNIKLHYNSRSLTIIIDSYNDENISSTKINVKENKIYKFNAFILK